jgi:hypothetical protein
MEPGSAARQWKDEEEGPLQADGRKNSGRGERVSYSQQRIFEACDCIIDLTSAFFNVSGRELRQPGRSREDVTRVRQIAMYLAHVMLGLPMGDVGKAFGRERTTVMHACHLVEDMRDDMEVDAIICRMERVIGVALRGHRLYWRGGRNGE